MATGIVKVRPWDTPRTQCATIIPPWLPFCQTGRARLGIKRQDQKTFHQPKREKKPQASESNQRSAAHEDVHGWAKCAGQRQASSAARHLQPCYHCTNSRMTACALFWFIKLQRDGLLGEVG